MSSVLPDRSDGSTSRFSSSSTAGALDDVSEEVIGTEVDAVVNAMSVDVEEHFQVSAFEAALARPDWEDHESRVLRNTHKLIDMFEEYGINATFFTLGWVAERAPDLVRRIVKAGHEIASHGYDHRKISDQTPDEFRQDVRNTKKLLEDLTGHAVVGYRAPSFSITKNTLWAHEILGEEGYRYSSSVYPIRHDHYGLPNAPRAPFRPSENGILEIPLSTTRIAGQNLPAAGGGYFRLLPLFYSRWAMRRINRIENRPIAFYFHPWEIDADQPRVSGIPLASRFRHYTNLRRFESRLKTVLAEFQWGRMDTVYSNAISKR